MHGGQPSGGLNSGIIAISGLPSRRVTPRTNNTHGGFEEFISSEDGE